MNVGTDVLKGLLIGVALLMVTLRLARRQADPSVRRIIAIGLVLKLLAAPAQMIVAATFYNNIADANRYHRQGLLASVHLLQGNLPPDLGRIVGSTFIELLTGVIYSLLTVTKLGGFFVYAWFGFVGLYLFYRAFQLTFPDADHVRYAKLVFFLPSLLFWPSSIGKDAWMTMTLGLAAYGVARVFTRRRGGFLLVVLALIGSSLVRPHVAALVFVAFAVAYAIPAIGRRTVGQRAAKLVGLTALALASVGMAVAVQTFFEVERLDLETIDQVLSKTEQLSETGNQRGDKKLETGYESSFDTSGSRSPVNFPRTIVTVLFRPLPFEAHNIPTLASSLEGSLLIVLVVLSRKRLRQVPRLSRRHPYVGFCILYTVVFIYFFSSIGNLGILARQRVQLLPFFLVLLALPVDEAQRRRRHVTAVPVGARTASPNGQDPLDDAIEVEATERRPARQT